MTDFTTPWFRDYVKFLLRCMDAKEVAQILANRGVPIEATYELLFDRKMDKNAV
jgi:hypothetical protein